MFAIIFFFVRTFAIVYCSVSFSFAVLLQVASIEHYMNHFHTTTTVYFIFTLSYSLYKLYSVHCTSNICVYYTLYSAHINFGEQRDERHHLLNWIVLILLFIALYKVRSERWKFHIYMKIRCRFYRARTTLDGRENAWQVGYQLLMCLCDGYIKDQILISHTSYYPPPTTKRRLDFNTLWIQSEIVRTNRIYSNANWSYGLRATQASNGFCCWDFLWFEKK